MLSNKFEKLNNYQLRLNMRIKYYLPFVTQKDKLPSLLFAITKTITKIAGKGRIL